MTPTPEALRHRASARRWGRTGLIGFTAASSSTNVNVIMAMPGATPMRIAIGALAPVVLAMISHLLTKLLQGELMVSGVAAAWYWSTAAAVGAIGAGAFWLSFDTLRRAAEPDHGGSAWVFPATLDLAIVVCTVALVVVARADEFDQRTAAVRAAEPVHVPVLSCDPHEIPIQHRPRTAPVDQLVNQPDTPVNRTDPQPVHDTVDQQVNHPVERPLTWDDADTGPVAVQVADRPVNHPDAVADQPQPQVIHEPVDQSGDSRVERSETEVVREPQPVRGSVNRGGLTLVDRDLDHRFSAERVVERTSSDWTPEQVEAVSRSTPGRGQRAIAEELEISATTVGRMRKAIAEVVAETETA
jgi:hypothetical protein